MVNAVINAVQPFKSKRLETGQHFLPAHLMHAFSSLHLVFGMWETCRRKGNIKLVFSVRLFLDTNRFSFLAYVLEIITSSKKKLNYYFFFNESQRSLPLSVQSERGPQTYVSCQRFSCLYLFDRPHFWKCVLVSLPVLNCASLVS